MLQKLYVTGLAEDSCIHPVTQRANSWFDTTQLQGKQPSLRPAFTGLHALFPTVSEMPTQAGVKNKCNSEEHAEASSGVFPEAWKPGFPQRLHESLSNTMI